MTAKENVSNAVSALQSAAERIRLIEQEAREILFVKDDSEKYSQKLQEKTMLLMELPDLVDPFMGDIPENFRKDLDAGLRSFAMRASQALELSSVFYMSALLYPETYKDGDPNDLESFVDRLRVKYLS